MASAQLIPLGDNTDPVAPIPLPNPVTLVGRHLDCDAKLPFPQISRRHCCIIQVNDRWLVRDLDSRNGVQVNGRRVRESPLRDGDEVAFGHLIYRLAL